MESSTPKRRRLLVERIMPEAVLPTRGSLDAAGFDLYAAENVAVPPRGRATVGTGICIEIERGWYGRIAPRSGLAQKCGLDVGAGVIDRDYRGTVGIILFNHTDKEHVVVAGDRVAQLVLTRYDEEADVVEVDRLAATTRGQGGFGSTDSSKVADANAETRREV